MRRKTARAPWWKVGLALLPGLVALLGQAFPAASEIRALRFLALAVVALLAVASTVLAVARRSTTGTPAWGLVPLGLLAGVGSAWAIEYLGFYAWWPLLVALGLVFARPLGATAALFVFVAGMVATSWQVEPIIYFWDSPMWRIVISHGMTVVFTLVTPLLVLRSRTVVGKVAGLLLPAIGYYAAYLIGKSIVRGMPFSFLDPAIAPVSVFLLAVLVAAVVYEWIAVRARREPAGNGDAVQRA